jgi:hypothetical protein
MLTIQSWEAAMGAAYFIGVIGVLLAAASIFGLVMAIRSLGDNDPDKMPLLFRALAQSLAPLNTAMGVIFAIAMVGLAILGGWMAYKGFTGG